jgi:hypothetical protein
MQRFYCLFGDAGGLPTGLAAGETVRCDPGLGLSGPAWEFIIVAVGP